jgi:hypothetical protein
MLGHRHGQDVRRVLGQGLVLAASQAGNALPVVAVALDDLDEAGLISAALPIDVDLGGIMNNDPSEMLGGVSPPLALLGRSLLRRAWAWEVKRTTVMLQPSSVIPAVEPSQPSASAPSCRCQRPRSLRIPGGLVARPWMTRMNMSFCPSQRCRCCGCVAARCARRPRRRVWRPRECRLAARCWSGRLPSASQFVRVGGVGRRRPRRPPPTACVLRTGPPGAGG